MNRKILIEIRELNMEEAIWWQRSIRRVFNIRYNHPLEGITQPKMEKKPICNIRIARTRKKKKGGK